MITKLEAPSPEVIVADKLQTDISINYGLTGETIASVTPKNTFQKIKKSLAMYPSRKDPIPNQEQNSLGTQKYQWLLSHVPPFIMDLNH